MRGWQGHRGESSVVNICGLQVGDDRINISFLGQPKLKLEVVGVSHQELEVMEEEEVEVAVVAVVVVVVDVERAMVEGGRAILGRLTSPRWEGCRT